MKYRCARTVLLNICAVLLIYTTVDYSTTMLSPTMRHRIDQAIKATTLGVGVVGLLIIVLFQLL